MAWLNDGKPEHHCVLPSTWPWSTFRPEDGFGARLYDWQDGKHVYPGAQWECDFCNKVWTLAKDGDWGSDDDDGD